MDIEQHRHYDATVRLRRSERFKVKPECEGIDGLRLTFVCAFGIDQEDSALYAGEWAMMPREYTPGFPGWIASGDLVDITPRALTTAEYRDA